MKNLTRSFVLILAIPLLGACQTERMLAKCPSTGILAETSSMSVFAPGKTMTPDNLMYRIDARQVTHSCSVDKDEHTADVSLEISFRAYRQRGQGPAEYTVPFYIAINDSDGNFVWKKTYSTKLAFQQNQATVDFQQPVDSVIVKVSRSKQAYDYHMIVGLQLTKQQLEYNRKTNRYAQ